MRAWSCLILTFALTGHALAADRVHAGLWQTIVSVGGMSATRSRCVSQAEADALNGDATAIRAWLDRFNAATGCKIRDLQVQDSQIVVTSVCSSGNENVGTTTYHGDTLETINTNGANAVARRIGPCT